MYSNELAQSSSFYLGFVKRMVSRDLIFGLNSLEICQFKQKFLKFAEILSYFIELFSPNKFRGFFTLSFFFKMSKENSFGLRDKPSVLTSRVAKKGSFLLWIKIDNLTCTKIASYDRLMLIQRWKEGGSWTPLRAHWDKSIVEPPTQFSCLLMRGKKYSSHYSQVSLQQLW